VFLALAVTEDLVAATIVLGILTGITSLASLAVAPLPASTRLAAYLAAGVQFFVLAALLISRFGAASFRFDTISARAVSPGTLAAAAVGAALCAGLYPFVPWRFRAQLRRPELERLRGVITMPAGAAAALLLLRLLGITRGDVSTIGLPGIPDGWRALLGLAVLAVLGAAALRTRRLPLRGAIAGAAAIALLAAYPALHWSHVVLVAALLSVLYAAAVSLAAPDQWDVVRYDVTLAAFWVALAVGTPTAVAGGLFLLAADAVSALAEVVWTGRYASYAVVIAGSAATVSGVFVILLGALLAADQGTTGLAIVCSLAIVGLVLVHVGQRLDLAQVPLALDGLAAAAAGGATAFVGLLVAVPIYQSSTGGFGRPFAPAVAASPFSVPAIIALATVLVVVARSVRPFVPDLGPLAERLRRAIAIADPVPAGLAAFAALDGAVSRTTRVFGLFEQRAGVWLATLLIAAVLVWSVRQ
jgi:hypothetical protein